MTGATGVPDQGYDCEEDCCAESQALRRVRRGYLSALSRKRDEVQKNCCIAGTTKSDEMDVPLNRSIE